MGYPSLMRLPMGGILYPMQISVDSDNVLLEKKD